MRRAKPRVFELASFAVLALGCGSARRSAAIMGEPRLGAAARRGELVFMRECHTCHPGGEGGLGPALNDKPAPPFLLKLQVRRGLGAMPAFSDREISDRELDDLVEYLLALRSHGR